MTDAAFTEIAADLRKRRHRDKFNAIISTDIIVVELERFLRTHYAGTREGALLDIGAGTKPYAALYERCFDRCVALDHEASPHDISGVDAIGSADALPFDD